MKRPDKNIQVTLEGSYIKLGDNMSFNWERYAKDLDAYIDSQTDVVVKQSQPKNKDNDVLLAEVDEYLLKVTSFIINSKANLKSHINSIIDEKFEFIEEDIKKANDAISEIKSTFI